MSGREQRVARTILWLMLAANVALRAAIASQRGFDRLPSEVDEQCTYACLPSVIIVSGRLVAPPRPGNTREALQLLLGIVGLARLIRLRRDLPLIAIASTTLVGYCHAASW